MENEKTGNERFDKAAEEIKKFAEKLSNEEKLQVYALFKQSTIGDVNTSRPGMFDMKGKAKWDSWESKKGMDKAKAQDEYADLVKKLAPEDIAKNL